MSSNKSNSKGAFERARDQWNCALIYMTQDLGRGGLNVSVIGALMLMHTSRSGFYRVAHLMAFPSLQRLAFMAGLNEKTVRRVLKELIRLGLVEVKHRFENSNLYYLVIPAAAEEHSRRCLDLLSNRSQMSGGVDNCALGNDVNVQGHSEGHSDLPTISKRHDLASCRLSEDQKDKRLSEEVRGRQDGEILQPIAQPILAAPPTSGFVPRRPSLEELRVKFNMPDLGKSGR